MRCFVAIDIDKDLREGIASIQEDLRRRLSGSVGAVKWVRPEQIHLTLKFLPEVDEQMLPQLYEAVALSVSGHERFSFEMPCLGSFGSPIRVVWIGPDSEIDALVKLQRDIEKALAESGWPEEDRPFSAHLTLARIKNRLRDNRLANMIRDYGRLNLAAVKVDSVAVYKSQLTPNGPVYTLLSRTGLK